MKLSEGSYFHLHAVSAITIKYLPVIVGTCQWELSNQGSLRLKNSSSFLNFKYGKFLFNTKR